MTDRLDEILLDMLQDERIPWPVYVSMTRRKFSNIRRILPRRHVVELLQMQREIDRMRANSPPPWNDPGPIVA